VAQSVSTDSGTISIPGAYADYQVVSSPSSLATSGVLVIMGESDQGPDFSDESDLGRNAFGPNSESEVVAKYGSGNLVKAYRGAVAAANDPDIKGSFTSAIFVKTNVSGKASGTLEDWTASTYATVQDRSYGKKGNLISNAVLQKQAEAVPTTGPFSMLVPTQGVNTAIRVNGGVAQSLTIAASETAATAVSAINGLTGVVATGGGAVGVVGTITGNLSLTVVSGNRVTLSYDTPWSGAALIPGDTAFIGSGSVLASVHANNAGTYIVTGQSANTISAIKARDVSGAHGALTSPTTQGSILVVGTSDLVAAHQVTISVSAGDPVDGLGKSLEIADLGTGAGGLVDIFYKLDASGPVTFFSTTAAPKIIVSATEYIADMQSARKADNLSEDIVAGGKVCLTIGYQGTSGTATIDGTNIVITVAGGAGASLGSLRLSDYQTVADLAAFIEAAEGYTSAPGTATLGSQSPKTLDQGTFHIASSNGGAPGRIKQDAYAFFTTTNANSVLVQLAAKAPAGLPAPSAIAFLTGGTLGGTTDAQIQLATSALRLVRANFVIPLFSRDATADIADGLTDASSSYTIAGIHSYVRAHVLQMSNMKAKRHRQAFLSIRDTFVNCQAVSANLASSRCCCSFEDVMDADGSVGVEQYQPWMAAVKAAAMQAGAFYQAIFAKGIAISGAVQAAGDFKDQDPDQVQEALQAGLLPIVRDETGLYTFSSDQTTYTADNNFVFNSIQAMYAADLVTLTTAQRMQKAFVGKSLADVSASLASTTISSIMADLMRLKLIAPSDDAPKGYKNVSIKIKGPVMAVKMAIKLSTSIYFVIINFTVEQVQQSA